MPDGGPASATVSKAHQGPPQHGSLALRVSSLFSSAAATPWHNPGSASPFVALLMDGQHKAYRRHASLLTQHNTQSLMYVCYVCLAAELDFDACAPPQRLATTQSNPQ